MISIHVMPNSLTIVMDSGTHIIAASDPRYSMILGAGIDEKRIKTMLAPKFENPTPEVETTVEEALDYKDDDNDTRIEVKPKEDKLLIDNKEMPEVLKKAFLELKRRHKPRAYLLKFWDKLQQNPDSNSIQMLYRFLEHNGHPIMADGDFIAYKAVNPDLLDHHTRTNKHRVGCVVKMDRDKVNPNPKETCSSGLHVCSAAYLKEYQVGDSRYLEILVNPKDVVCVPDDYQFTKLRSSRYKVCREVKFEEIAKRGGILESIRNNR